MILDLLQMQKLFELAGMETRYNTDTDLFQYQLTGDARPWVGATLSRASSVCLGRLFYRNVPHDELAAILSVRAEDAAQPGRALPPGMDDMEPTAEPEGASDGNSSDSD